MAIEVDLNRCTLSELLDLMDGTAATAQIIVILRKVIVGGRETTDKMTGAQLREVIAQLGEAIKADMNPKETA